MRISFFTKDTAREKRNSFSALPVKSSSSLLCQAKKGSLGAFTNHTFYSVGWTEALDL